MILDQQKLLTRNWFQFSVLTLFCVKFNLSRHTQKLTRKCGRYRDHCTYITHCRRLPYPTTACATVNALRFVCPSVANLPDEDRQSSIEKVCLLVLVSKI